MLEIEAEIDGQPPAVRPGVVRPLGQRMVVVSLVVRACRPVIAAPLSSRTPAGRGEVRAKLMPPSLAEARGWRKAPVPCYGLSAPVARCRPDHASLLTASPSSPATRAKPSPRASASARSMAMSTLRGRRHRRAGRRRLHAADAASLHGHRQADLRHEPRLGRLPDERVPRARACSSGSTRPSAASIHPLLMVATDATASAHTALRHQRGLAAAPDLPGGQAAHLHRRQDAAGGARRATACWWRRPPARPPTISPPTGRSCRSTRRCWR